MTAEHRPDLAARVPAEFAPMFFAAQRAVAEFFAERGEKPMEGTIEVSGERYVLVRAASLSSEFFSLVASLYADHGEEKARHVAEGLLFDLGHAIGVADAKAFHERMNLVDPVDKLAAGPIHFAYSGWAFVELLPESAPSPDSDFFLAYRHPHSFEADAWISQGRQAAHPVCIMNAGYSSGWCEASFSIPLVATEVTCRGAGDEHCEFVMAPPDRIAEYVARRPGRTRARGHRRSTPEFFARKRRAEESRSAQMRLEEMVAERTAALDEAISNLRREAAERERSEDRLRQVQKMDAVGTLAGGVAHDFNNLLTAIIGGIQLARLDVAADSAAAENLDLALESASRAGDLTRQLLSVGRRQDAAIKPTQLNAVVRDMGRFLRRSLPPAIDVELTLSPAIDWLHADSALLEQALINLAINSRDAMPEGGRIVIATAGVDESGNPTDAERATHVRLRVSDDGSGIAPEVVGKVFEPFFTTKDRGEGTGLGLALVYSTAEKHGGWVSVTSETGQGSTFSVVLPWVRAEPPEPSRPSSARSELRSGAGTILVVEDTHEVRAQTVRILERVGYEVIAATGAEHALARLTDSAADVDLVLTDMIMPRGDGASLLGALRERGCSAPVVLMSGFTGDGDARPSVAGGFAAFLPKPFGADTLTETIRRVLDAHQVTE